MNSRQSKIIETLISSKGQITLPDLAERFSVSLRTIQNDIVSINFEIKKLGLTPLVNKYGSGVLISEKDEWRNELRKLSTSDNKIVVLNGDERIETIYKIFLLAHDYVTINELASHLDISRGTVLNDLKRLRKELLAFAIEISSSERKGNKISGNEMTIREFAVHKYLKRAEASCLYSAEEYHQASITNSYYPVRSLEESTCIYRELQVANENLKKNMTGNAFLLIIGNLEIAIERIKNGNVVSLSNMQMDSLYGTREYRAMHEMTESISKVLDIEFPPEEVGYLTLLTICSDMVHAGIDIKENFADIQILVCNLIRQVEKHLKIDFSQDVSLYSDLVYHIRPAIYRIKNNIRQPNHLKEDVRKMYPEIFEAVQNSTDIIEGPTQTQMSDDEIGFIAIHFASVYEKKRRRLMTTPNVLVVCDFGIGTSNLLAARLVSLYDVNIVDIVAFYAIKEALETQKVDYIVSALDVAYSNETVIRVNPMLTKEDIVILDKYFHKRQINEIDEDYFMEVIERNSVISDKEQLKEDLSKEFSFIFKNNKRKDEHEKMLIEVMGKQMIQLDYIATDWEDAVRQSGKLLMDGDCIEQEYIESMVSTVKKMGSYIVIAKGIALPHSRSGDYAHKVGISFLRLKEPVKFGHPENDPVDLLFGLSSVDDKEHLRALRDLTKILINDENIEFMRKAKDVSELYDFLCEIGGDN